MRRPLLRRLLAGGFYAGTCLITIVLAAELSFHAAYAVRNMLVSRVPLPYVIGSDYGPVPPWVDGLRILEPDPVLIWKGRPRLRRTYVDVFGPAMTERDRLGILHQFRPDSSTAFDKPVWDVALNSEGFREEELPRTKPPGTIRIVCLGDSWTFGANVSADASYPRQLAARLRRNFPGRQFEVLNLGVLGYSSYQGLQLLRHRAAELEPDVVILGFGMNDASVAGFRDKDIVQPATPWPGPFDALQQWSQVYRFVRYRRQRAVWEPPTLARTITDRANRAAGADSFDYMSMEQWTRVSPVDYEHNLREMIALVRRAGADVILLFNEIWTRSPYRDVVAQVAEDASVDFVDTAVLIREERTRMEQALENELGLPPASTQPPPQSDSTVEIVFRVRASASDAPHGVFIVGADAQLGALVPNLVSMHDDGTHGDQRAADGVWSYTARFAPGSEVFYVYTVGGSEYRGRWIGLDVPEARNVTVSREAKARWYAPIDTFGQIYMQADSWHTNAAGYSRLAQTLVTGIDRRALVRR